MLVCKTVSDCRPTAAKVLKLLVSIFTEEDDPYIQVDLVELINKADERVLSMGLPGGSFLESTNEDSNGFLKRRIKEFKVAIHIVPYLQHDPYTKHHIHPYKKDGVPGVLEIFRLHGKVKFTRKQGWRRQVFQIKDGFLKYFKSSAVRCMHI